MYGLSNGENIFDLGWPQKVEGIECGFDTHKNALMKNLVILFVFFHAVEPIYSFFKTIVFFNLKK